MFEVPPQNREKLIQMFRILQLNGFKFQINLSDGQPAIIDDDASMLWNSGLLRMGETERTYWTLIFYDKCVEIHPGDEYVLPDVDGILIILTPLSTEELVSYVRPTRAIQFNKQMDKIENELSQIESVCWREFLNINSKFNNIEIDEYPTEQFDIIVVENNPNLKCIVGIL